MLLITYIQLSLFGKTSWERFLQMTGWTLEPSYYKECKGKKKQCRKKFRALIVEPRPSGHRGPKS